MLELRGGLGTLRPEELHITLSWYVKYCRGKITGYTDNRCVAGQIYVAASLKIFHHICPYQQHGCKS
jgi:hypothetical protein